MRRPCADRKKPDRAGQARPLHGAPQQRRDGLDGGTAGMRKAQLQRTTTETDIHVRLNLDGRGRACVPGVRSLDDMLELVARHGALDLEVVTRGDLDVDQYHRLKTLAWRWAKRRESRSARNAGPCAPAICVARGTPCSGIAWASRRFSPQARKIRQSGFRNPRGKRPAA